MVLAFHKPGIMAIAEEAFCARWDLTGRTTRAMLSGHGSMM